MEIVQAGDVPAWTPIEGAPGPELEPFVPRASEGRWWRDGDVYAYVLGDGGAAGPCHVVVACEGRYPTLAELVAAVSAHAPDGAIMSIPPLIAGAAVGELAGPDPYRVVQLAQAGAMNGTVAYRRAQLAGVRTVSIGGAAVPQA